MPVRPLRRCCALLLFGLAGLGLLSPAAVDQQRMREVMQSRYGDEGSAILEAWFRLLNDNRDLAETEQVEAVNSFFNRHIRFAEDRDIWGVEDYWATPLETLGVRRGDCEDYAIAKYMSLKMLGIPRERLRLIYVRAQLTGGHSQAHMVLGYYATTDAAPLILDNLNPQVLPAQQRPDLRPVFSFNSAGLWVGSNTQPQADPTARLSRWRDVLQRMEQEGLR